VGRLRACEIFNNGAYTLIAIESIDFRHTRTKTGGYMFGTIIPIAVIMCVFDGITVFDLDGKPADFEALRRDIPELNSLLPSLHRLVEPECDIQDET